MTTALESLDGRLENVYPYDAILIFAQRDRFSELDLCQCDHIHGFQLLSTKFLN
jgi:hypothetical protein